MHVRPWQEYKRLRNVAVLWIAAFATLPLFIAYISTQIVGSVVPGFVLALITMAGAVFSVWQLITWPCPRCGEVFGVPLWSRCRHCGLLKGQAPDLCLAKTPSGRFLNG